MASELKLSGSAGGRIIVQGNDTITTDQTFTFPDTGGELATKACWDGSCCWLSAGDLDRLASWNS